MLSRADPSQVAVDWRLSFGGRHQGGQWLDESEPYCTIHRLASTAGSHGIARACFEWLRCHTPSRRCPAPGLPEIEIITYYHWQHDYDTKRRTSAESVTSG